MAAGATAGYYEAVAHGVTSVRNPKSQRSNIKEIAPPEITKFLEFELLWNLEHGIWDFIIQ
jgi:hypothetical protein